MDRGRNAGPIHVIAEADFHRGNPLPGAGHVGQGDDASGVKWFVNRGRDRLSSLIVRRCRQVQAEVGSGRPGGCWVDNHGFGGGPGEGERDGGAESERGRNAGLIHTLAKGQGNGLQTAGEDRVSRLELNEARGQTGRGHGRCGWGCKRSSWFGCGRGRWGGWWGRGWVNQANLEGGNGGCGFAAADDHNNEQGKKYRDGQGNEWAFHGLYPHTA